MAKPFYGAALGAASWCSTGPFYVVNATFKSKDGKGDVMQAYELNFIIRCLWLDKIKKASLKELRGASITYMRTSKKELQHRYELGPREVRLEFNGGEICEVTCQDEAQAHAILAAVGMFAGGTKGSQSSKMPPSFGAASSSSSKTIPAGAARSQSSPPAALEPWSCTKCTFCHLGELALLPSCTMCDTPRPQRPLTKQAAEEQGKRPRAGEDRDESTSSRDDEDQERSKKRPRALTEDEKMCVICLEREKDAAVIPCGHLCGCEECLKTVKECPMCRGQISSINKIWKS